MSLRLVLLLLAATPLLGACRRGPPPLAPEGPEWLATVVHDQVQAAAPGAQQVGELRRGMAYEEDDLTDFHVNLERSVCYWFSAAGEPQVEELYLNLWDPERRRVAKHKQERSHTMLTHCAAHTGVYRFQVKVTEGRGHFHFGVYARGPGDAPLAGAGCLPSTSSEVPAVERPEPALDAPQPIEPVGPDDIVPPPLADDLEAAVDRQAR